jgi:RNA recognition motif-containing protein
MNLYIGNLSYNLSETELQDAFGEFGEVTKVKIIKDRDSGKSKGFGFVEMKSSDEGLKAIAELNGKSLKGREIKVNEARPK